MLSERCHGVVIGTTVLCFLEDFNWDCRKKVLYRDVKRKLPRFTKFYDNLFCNYLPTS